MACGLSVIASHAAALPEVVGDTGVLVNPWDVEALVWAIGRLFSDHELRHNLRVQGLKRVQCFSWAEAAKKALNVYRQVAIR